MIKKAIFSGVLGVYSLCALSPFAVNSAGADYGDNLIYNPTFGNAVISYTNVYDSRNNILGNAYSCSLPALFSADRSISRYSLYTTATNSPLLNYNVNVQCNKSENTAWLYNVGINDDFYACENINIHYFGAVSVGSFNRYFRDYSVIVERGRCIRLNMTGTAYYYNSPYLEPVAVEFDYTYSTLDSNGDYKLQFGAPLYNQIASGFSASTLFVSYDLTVEFVCGLRMVGGVYEKEPFKCGFAYRIYEPVNSDEYYATYNTIVGNIPTASNDISVIGSISASVQDFFGIELFPNFTIGNIALIGFGGVILGFLLKFFLGG